MKKTAFVFITLLFLLLFCSCSGNDTYIIGTDDSLSPFCSLDTEGNVEGFDIDLLTAISEAEGFRVEFKPLGLLDSLDALDGGDVDAVMAAVISTDEFNEKYDFSDLYYNSEFAVAVKKNKNGKLIELFNDGLAKVTESGKYRELLEKYSLEDVADYE